jgi:cbb3-type cytochrome oxidase maturation protein
MSVIFIVVPLATFVVLVAVVAFVISVRRGQFDDLDTPSVRMLHDDAVSRPREPRSLSNDAKAPAPRATRARPR